METRSRSRSPLRQHNELHTGSGRASPTPSNASASSSMSRTSFKEARKNAMLNAGKFHIKITNVPLYWKWYQVSAYIKKHTSAVDRAIAEDIAFVIVKPCQHSATQDSLVSFKSEHRRNQAFDKLKCVYEKVDGKKLYVTKTNAEGKFQKRIFSGSKNTGQVVKFPHNSRQNQNNTPLRGEDTETYGLSVDYLRELEIKPPLTRKIFVRSLPDQYNDEAKARSLFSQAGTVVSVVLLIKPPHINARIEFDHPVEAVQAISMFNNREIFGKKITCEMDNMKKIWIDGMPLHGPGLGPNATPLRGVRVALEIKKVKAEIMNEFQRLSDSVDELKAQVMNLMHATNSAKQMTASTPNVPNTLQNAPNTLLNVSNPLLNVANPLTSNSLAALGSLITNQLQPMQLLQNLVQQNSGNDLGVLGNALQSLTGSNISNILQAQSTNQNGDSNIQGGSNMQSGMNMQSGPSNDVSGPFNNMQHGLSNIQSGQNNMQGSSIQAVSSNMQSGLNNIQSGLNNMQSGPFNMLGGSANNAQSSNMQSGYFNIQSGPSNEMANIQTGSQNIQHANQNAFGSNSNSFTPKQQGSSNMQSGFPYNNMQLGSGSGQNQQANTNFGGPQFNSNNVATQNMAGNASTMLLFKNLPMSVTLPALQAKMREVGEVKFIQMTGPGRALINFFLDQDANKCIKLFNQSKVDGQIIEVKKM